MMAHGKCNSWNGCDDVLRDDIKKNKHVKRVRKELMKKKLKSRLKN